MSEEKPHTAMVCDGEVDTDDEEPPTPHILDSQSAPAGGANVFFLQTDQQQTESTHLSRNDSLCDELTPTTEQYRSLGEQLNRTVENTDTGQCSQTNSQSASSYKSMTESSDIEVIEEKDSSDSIEVLDYDSANSHGNSHSKNYAEMCENIRKIQVTDSKNNKILHKKVKNKEALQNMPDAIHNQLTDNQPSTSSKGKDSKISDTSQPVANGNAHRPNDLSLPRPLKVETHHDSDNEVFEDDLVRSFKDTDRLIEAVASTPLQTQGTVIQEGDMVAFVAEDLQAKIIHSPPSRTESLISSRYGSRTPSSRSMSSLSSSSASGWSGISTSGMSRSPSVLTQSPEDMPPIDPRAVFDLEMHARKVADSLDTMMKHLKMHVHKMSSYTTAGLCAYQEGVDHTCDSVDATIKSMYALMAKCEELSKTMLPVYEINEQIKEIKRLLDLFEGQLVKED